jgi:RNA polymerase sigma factor (sigma-70 family)
MAEPASPAEFARQDAARLMGYLLKLGVGFHDAQDLVAETIGRMCERWDSIDSPRAWAHSTAFHLAVDHFRKLRNEHDRIQAHLTHQASTVPLAEDLYMLKEEHRTVIGHIRGLPTQQRNVLALHLDGFTHKEIADMLEVNARTVASNLRHAKHRLRVTLEAEGVYNPTPLDSRGGQ